MTSAIEMQKRYKDNLIFYMLACQRDILITIVARNVLIALGWEALLVRAFVDLNNAATTLTADGKETFMQFKRPEAIITEKPWEKIDVRNVDDLRTAEQAGKKPSKGKKKTQRTEEKKQKDEADKAAKRKADNERLNNWQESWNKKLQAQEELDNVPCCMGEGLCLKPRTQSNIWINVFQNKTTQEMQMCFKHVPLPKPKPPPLPPLKKKETEDNVLVEKKNTKKTDKMGRKRGKKKK